MDRGGGAQATQKVDAHRVAVRSTAWLDDWGDNREDIELRFFSPREKYLNHGLEFLWATCPAKLEIAYGAMNPVGRVLRIPFERRERLSSERCVSQLDVKGPTRIV